jgi:transcriptional regulator GlxA family with amidase domain
MQTKARRVVVIAYEELDLLDVAAPLAVFSSAGRRWNFRPYKVTVVGTGSGLISTRDQLRIEAAEPISAAAPADIVLLPGGYGARRWLQEPTHLTELNRLAAGAEWIAAVGSGVLPVLAAGLLPEGQVSASADLASTSEAQPFLGQLDTAERGVLASGRVLSVARSAGAVELSLAIVRNTLGPKLVAMVRSELGLEPEAEPLKIRYD